MGKQGTGIKQSKRFTPALLAKQLADNPQLSILSGSPGLLRPTTDIVRVAGSEHTMQQRLFQEIDRMALADPVYGMIYAVPNGQYRAGQRPEPGMRAGVPDICLASARFPYHGGYLELKVKGNGTSPDQDDWLRRLSAQGYYCQVVRDSVEKAIETIQWYFSLPEW